MKNIILFTLLASLFSVSSSFADKPSPKPCDEVLSRLIAALGMHDGTTDAVTVPGREKNCSLLINMIDTQVIGAADFSLRDEKSGAIYNFRGTSGQMAGCQSDMKSVSASSTFADDFDGAKEFMTTVSFDMINLPSSGLSGGSITIDDGQKAPFSCQF